MQSCDKYSKKKNNIKYKNDIGNIFFWTSLSQECNQRCYIYWKNRYLLPNYHISFKSFFLYCYSQRFSITYLYIINIFCTFLKIINTYYPVWRFFYIYIRCYDKRKGVLHVSLKKNQMKCLLIVKRKHKILLYSKTINNKSEIRTLSFYFRIPG